MPKYTVYKIVSLRLSGIEAASEKEAEEIAINTDEDEMDLAYCNYDVEEEV